MTEQRSRKPFQAIVASVVLAALAAAAHDARSADRVTGEGGVAAERRAQQPDPLAAPRELVLEGMAKMLQALNALIESVPQYGPPQIDENGDIVLRRKRPEGPKPRPPSVENWDSRPI